MNEVIHDFQVHHLYLCALVIFICFTTILIAMTIDLIAGIQKAKELHVARTSTGLKKTCDKAKKYFPTFGIASLMDWPRVLSLPSRCSQSPGRFICFCASSKVLEKKRMRRLRYASKTVRCK